MDCRRRLPDRNRAAWRSPKRLIAQGVQLPFDVENRPTTFELTQVKAMSRQRISLSIAILSSLVISTVTSADIVFSNFGQNDSYNEFAGATIGGASRTEQGSLFTVTGQDYLLNSIEIPIFNFSGNNQVTLTLYTAIGNLPNTILEQSNGSAAPSNSIVTFLFSGNTVLSENETYIVAANSINDGSSGHSWRLNNIGQTGPRPIRMNGGSWSAPSSTLPAFRVNGTAVPEPASSVVFSLTSLTILARRRRR